jgi:hypothetical protein
MRAPSQATFARAALAVAALLLGAAVAAEQAPPAQGAAAIAGKLPANLPVRRDSASTIPASAWDSAIALLSIGGAAGGLWLWRRRSAPAGGLRKTAVGHFPVVRLSSQALTPQASVHVVQWKGEEYLLGCAGQQLTLLARKAADAGAGDER